MVRDNLLRIILEPSADLVCYLLRNVNLKSNPHLLVLDTNLTRRNMELLPYRINSIHPTFLDVALELHNLGRIM